jgi:hypothetical protein
MRVLELLLALDGLAQSRCHPEGAHDVRHIAGAIAFTLDGRPRNSFDPFTALPGATHHIVLHAPPEVAARIPPGQLMFSTGARPHHFEHEAR